MLSLGLGLWQGGAGAAAAAAHETLKTLASDAGAEALYDPDNPDTWTLRDDGSDLWYSALADALGNREDMVQGTASLQTKQITLSTGRRARLAAVGKYLLADFASAITQPNTIVAVWRETALTDLARVVDTLDVTGGRQVISRGSANSNWRMWAGSFLNGPNNSGDTSWHFTQANYNGSSSELFFDGASVASGDAGTNALGGMQDDSANSTRVDVETGPIIVFPSLKTNGELSDIRDHINANWPIGSSS